MHAFGFINAGQAADGRQQIDRARWRAFNPAAANTLRPEEDSGGRSAALEVGPLVTLQTAIPIGWMDSVVRIIDDQGVVELSGFLELGNEATDGAIGVVDRGGVNRGFILQVAVNRNDVVRGGNLGVWLIEPDV